MTPPKNYLRERRQALNLTLEQLSKKTGIPYSTIRDAELGSAIAVTVALKLARALKTKPEELWPPEETR